MDTVSKTYVPFGDRNIGDRFDIHAGANQWISGEKVGQFEFRKNNGVVIGVSVWTKTK